MTSSIVPAYAILIFIQTYVMTYRIPMEGDLAYGINHCWFTSGSYEPNVKSI